RHLLLMDELGVGALELLAGAPELLRARLDLLLQDFLGAPLVIEEHLVLALDAHVGGDVAIRLDDKPALERRGGDRPRQRLPVAPRGPHHLHPQRPPQLVRAAADAGVLAHLQRKHVVAVLALLRRLLQRPPAGAARQLVRAVVVEDAAVRIEHHRRVRARFEQRPDGLGYDVGAHASFKKDRYRSGRSSKSIGAPQRPQPSSGISRPRPPVAPTTVSLSSSAPHALHAYGARNDRTRPGPLKL